MIDTISGTEGPFIQVMAVATGAAFAATPVVGRYLATPHTRRQELHSPGLIER